MSLFRIAVCHQWQIQDLVANGHQSGINTLNVSGLGIVFKTNWHHERTSTFEFQSFLFVRLYISWYQC